MSDDTDPQWATRNLAMIHDDFRVSTGIQDMHNALLAQMVELVAEQKRTSQLLEWIGQRIGPAAEPGSGT